MPRLRTHPGEILAEEYLKPLGLSANALAQAIGAPSNRISDIIRRRRDVSADTAIRLGRFFSVDPRFWLNLQTAICRWRRANMTIRACGRGPTRLREPDRNSRAGGLLGGARRRCLAVLSHQNGISSAKGEILEKTLAMEPFRQSKVVVQAP